MRIKKLNLEVEYRNISVDLQYVVNVYSDDYQEIKKVEEEYNELFVKCLQLSKNNNNDGEFRKLVDQLTEKEAVLKDLINEYLRSNDKYTQNQWKKIFK